VEEHYAGIETVVVLVTEDERFGCEGGEREEVLYRYCWVRDEGIDICKR
jgi:hypothetical protein